MTRRSKETDPVLMMVEGVDDDQAVDVLLRVASGQVPRLLALQGEFGPLVDMAIDAPDLLYKQEFDARLRELAQGGVTINVGSAITRSGKNRQVYYPEYRDIHAYLSHALLLLMDEQKPYGAALCRCKLPSCGHPYLAKRNPRGGPLNRAYCSAPHRDEHHNSFARKVAKPRKGK